MLGDGRGTVVTLSSGRARAAAGLTRAWSVVLPAGRSRGAASPPRHVGGRAAGLGVGCWEGVSLPICNWGGVRPGILQGLQLSWERLCRCLCCLAWNVRAGLGCWVPHSAPVAPLTSPGTQGWGIETLKLHSAPAGHTGAVCRLATAVTALRHCTLLMQPTGHPAGRGQNLPLPMPKVPACSQGLLHGAGGSPATGTALPSLALAAFLLIVGDAGPSSCSTGPAAGELCSLSMGQLGEPVPAVLPCATGCRLGASQGSQNLASG